MARWVRHALAEIRDGRPFTDSETGPIHTFKDLGITLPEVFDLAYFRHMAWAHLASGGAGGGMRWPNRHPHTLTPGMRHAQGVMADFARLIDWPNFAVAERLATSCRCEGDDLLAYACADDRQAVAWAIRGGDDLDPHGHLAVPSAPHRAALILPPMAPGPYRVPPWRPTTGTSWASRRSSPAASRSASSCPRSATTSPSPCDPCRFVGRTVVDSPRGLEDRAPGPLSGRRPMPKPHPCGGIHRREFLAGASALALAARAVSAQEPKAGAAPRGALGIPGPYPGGWSRPATRR